MAIEDADTTSEGQAEVRRPTVDSGTLSNRIYARYAETHLGYDRQQRQRSPPGAAAQLNRCVRRFFPRDPRARILDLGCGSGALLKVAAELGYDRLVGVDATLAGCGSAEGPVELVGEDAITYLQRCNGAEFDFIVAYDFLEHLSDDNLIECCDHIHRILAPGGAVLGHLPNGESPLGGRARYWDITHYRSFTRNSVNQLFLSTGFDTPMCYEDPPTIHGTKSALRWAIWNCLAMVARLYIAAETGEMKGAIVSMNMFVHVRKPSGDTEI